MAILIKGMEMPKRCADCWLMDGEDSWCCACRGKSLSADFRYGIKERPSWCPLVELPPHGRLIDGDALRLTHCKECTPYPDKCMENAGEECDWNSIYHIDHLAPTIIEAEGVSE